MVLTMKVLILAILLLRKVYCQDPKVQYLAQLIQDETTKATTYQLPTSNAEFTSGFQSTETTDFGSYDFIIVGSGSAGSVLATRLSEIDCFNILLLEAGGEENDFNQIPGVFFYHQFSPMNWGYQTTRQKNACLGMIDNKCMVPRGKVIGGSSSINSIEYVRGNPNDYDNWVKLGNRGWSYKEVLPYFKKSENSQINGDSGYHGKGGLWNVEYSEPTSPLYKNFLRGTSDLNISYVDYNGRTQFGSSQMQFNMKRGRRQSTGTAFLDMARKRKNLKVVTNALVTRILIKADTKKTQGVEFITKDKKFKATAKREVIVSGGAVNSPQLLMLSGIGPADQLTKLGIKLIVDLPVGKQVLEHPLFPGLIIRTNQTYTSESIEVQIKQYLNGRGLLAKSASVDGLSFINTKGRKDVPNLECYFNPPFGDDQSILARITNFNDTLLTSVLAQINSSTDIMIQYALLHEKSRGSLTLKSTSPLDFPNIDLNILAEEDDVNTFIDGIKIIIDLIKTKAFQEINAQLFQLPICSDYAKSFKLYWTCIIRAMAITDYHICGTTPMGTNPKTSVVDPFLKVHGIKKLRVIDAGIFPTTISGNTNAPTVMVAEKGADMIKKDYEYLK